MTVTPTLAVIAVVSLAIVVVIRFEVFCLTDLARTSDAELRYLPRTTWIVVIACTIPIGGILYLYCGRVR